MMTDISRNVQVCFIFKLSLFHSVGFNFRRYSSFFVLQDFPQPWNGESFVNSLLEVMLKTSANNRCDILSAIMEIFQQYGAGDKEVIAETLTTILKTDPLEMGYIQENEMLFVKSALKHLFVCFQPKDDLVVYLVAYFVHGNRELK